MKILIVGLGNPGKQYSHNRHTIGFMFIDWLASQYDAKPWKFDKYTYSELTNATINDTRNTLQVVFAKPQTFMNNSGNAVKKLVTASHDIRSTLYVVHDDLDIRLGNFKIQQGVGPKVHNGIDSIEQSLKTKDFWRIRIGIDNRDSDFEGSGEGYVLSDFTKEEKIQFRNIFQKINTRFLDMI